MDGQTRGDASCHGLSTRPLRTATAGACTHSRRTKLYPFLTPDEISRVCCITCRLYTVYATPLLLCRCCCCCCK